VLSLAEKGVEAMIDFNAGVGSVLSNLNKLPPQMGSAAEKHVPGGAEGADFNEAIKAVGKYISKVDDLQQSSDISVQDLLSGRSQDITAVVSAVAKADMSFKLLVGVRNKLIEAYKQTMNMPL
jgi:flagellar hook-basal body complex protein FliE